MMDLDELERLAQAAQANSDNIGEQDWYPPDDISCASGGMISQADAGLMAGCAPQVILELIAEVRRLNSIVEKYIDPGEVRMTGMTPMDGGLFIGLEGGACRAFAGAFADQFRESGGTNYVEMRFETGDPQIGELLVTLQRIQGKSPAQFRQEAEAERDALLADAERWRQLERFGNPDGEIIRRETRSQQPTVPFEPVSQTASPTFKVDTWVLRASTFRWWSKEKEQPTLRHAMDAARAKEKS